MNYFFTFILNVSFLIALTPTRDDAMLFCLRPEIENLEIIHRDNIISVNNAEINAIIKNYNITEIERWLPHARETENLDDLYLNRIYRVIIDGNREQLESLKSDLESLSNILKIPKFINCLK